MYRYGNILYLKNNRNMYKFLYNTSCMALAASLRKMDNAEINAKNKILKW